MQGHDVKIVQKNCITAQIYIDGKEIQGVTDIRYDIGIERLPEITMSFRAFTLNFDREGTKEVLKEEN